MSGSLPVLIITLIVRLFSGRTPQQLALITVRSARTLITKCFSNFARSPVHFVHVIGAELALAVAILGQVALVISCATCRSGQLRPTRGKIATIAGGASGIGVELASVGIAARVVAVVLHAAVASLSGLDKTVAANGSVKNCERFVSQAVVHAVFKCQGQVLETARAPEGRLHGGGGGSHDTLVI